MNQNPPTPKPIPLTVQEGGGKTIPEGGGKHLSRHTLLSSASEEAEAKPGSPWWANLLAQILWPSDPALPAFPDLRVGRKTSFFQSRRKEYMWSAIREISWRW
jgi:hypothetical protein